MHTKFTTQKIVDDTAIVYLCVCVSVTKTLLNSRHFVENDNSEDNRTKLANTRTFTDCDI